MPRPWNPESEAAFFILLKQGVFEIDSDGAIWKLKRRGSEKPYERRRAERASKPKGYMQVHFFFEGRHCQPSAHRLVYIHFNGPIPNGLTVNHEDGNKQRNHPGNLVLATDSEQMLHAVHVLGTARTANQWSIANHASKLEVDVVSAIRSEYVMGKVTMDTLGTKYGVTLKEISRIIRGERRTKDPGSIDLRDHRHSVSKRDPVTGRFTNKRISI